MRENELLARLPSLFHSDDPSVILGSGPDDCAHVRTADGVLSVSTDAFAEGVHFLAGADPRDVARKCLGASLSDLAASACRPRWALVSLCLRPGLPAGWDAAFAEEIAATAKQYGVTIVGGDTVASKGGVFVSVTVMGSPLPGGPILRSGARPGDVVAVTGELGGSLLGRHLAPVPRFREIEALMRFRSNLGQEPAFPCACMDISDGLAIDLARLCRESGVGAVVDEDSIPVSPQAFAMAERSGRTPCDHALADGEDFELLIALPPEAWEEFGRLPAERGESGYTPAKFTRIGTIVAEKRLTIVNRDGESRPLEAKGFEHTW